MFTPKLTSWSVGLALAGLAIVPTGTRAQQPAPPPAAAPTPRPAMQPTPEMLERQKLTEADHQRLMDLLHMTSIRRDRDGDRKSTRLNSSHLGISYAVF